MRLTIDRLGHLGDGVAGQVFVPQTLPGEVVEGELVGDRLTGAKIVTPSSARVRPPCVHARTCGGCMMQHASDAFVAAWKQDIVQGALAGQGLSAPFRPVIMSPPQSRRRATLTGRKTKGGALLGFHARGSDMLIPVPQCKILVPQIMGAFPALAALTRAGGSRSAELSLTVTESAAGPDVNVCGGKSLESGLIMDLARIAEAHGLSRLAWDGEVVALRAAPVQRFGRVAVVPPPGAFLQATREGEQALLAGVKAAVNGAGRIADLFAGVGTFALPLTESADVVAIEGVAAMTAAMEKGWRAAERLKRLTVGTRDLFRRPLEADELAGFEAVVIDPPRAGADAQVACLAKSTVRAIAMVSCNPVTFARDARVLVQAGYRIEWVQVVDQFRWSAHVELVALLSRG